MPSKDDEIHRLTRLPFTRMLDPSVHSAIIKLTIAYSLLGAFLFTLAITCLSVIGRVKFASRKQQSTLFATLVVEVAVICVGSFSNFLNFNTQQAQAAVQRPLIAELAREVELNERLKAEVQRGLRPEVAKLAQRLIDNAAQEGIDVRIIKGNVSFEEQNELYAQGRTKPGNIVTNAPGGFSNHNFGLAFDVGVFDGGGLVPESPRYRKLGEIGRSLGLEWGGDWKTIKDEPHFQLRPQWAIGLTERDMLAQLRARSAGDR